jgi:hypothetical protein
MLFSLSQHRILRSKGTVIAVIQDHANLFAIELAVVSIEMHKAQAMISELILFIYVFLDKRQGLSQCSPFGVACSPMNSSRNESVIIAASLHRKDRLLVDQLKAPMLSFLLLPPGYSPQS